jgi:ribosomal protein S18 acetylase RimI-like enzyme
MAAPVRLARAADVPALLDEMTAFNRHERIPWRRARGEPALRRLIATPALGQVVVAPTAGRAPTIDGYTIVTWGFDLEWNGRDAMLTELWVAPRARGRGLGGRLLAEAERRARAGGAAAMHLMVRHRNVAARALYDRVGFVAPGRLLLTKPLRGR